MVLLGGGGIALTTKLVMLAGVLAVAVGGSWMMRDYGETTAERDFAVQANKLNAATLQDALDRLDAIRAGEAEMRAELADLRRRTDAALAEIARMEGDWLDWRLDWGEDEAE